MLGYHAYWIIVGQGPVVLAAGRIGLFGIISLPIGLHR